jgi:hypothetical protein
VGNSPEDEARVFGRYLLRREPSVTAAQLYCSAMRRCPVDCNSRDEKIIRFVMRNRRLLPLIDGALAFSKKRSALRTKLLIMTAILETQPEYTELFLPQQRAAGYWIIVGFRLCAAAFRLVCGKIILAFL